MSSAIALVKIKGVSNHFALCLVLIIAEFIDVYIYKWIKCTSALCKDTPQKNYVSPEVVVPEYTHESIYLSTQRCFVQFRRCLNHTDGLLRSEIVILMYVHLNETVDVVTLPAGWEALTNNRRPVHKGE